MSGWYPPVLEEGVWEVLGELPPDQDICGIQPLFWGLKQFAREAGSSCIYGSHVCGQSRNVATCSRCALG